MSSTRSPKSAAGPAGSPSSPAPRRGLMIGAIVAGLVVVALVVALLASGGDDDGGEAQSPATTSASSGGTSSGPAEQQPVSVEGTARDRDG